ncbi:hypothetical protein [Kribbella deserti]|uniref:Uncharacterized protein n=1 Tax=Kribbella deserti TaxID=1926257 RepID=A0ABV6QMW5_9ACTN
MPTFRERVSGLFRRQTQQQQQPAQVPGPTPNAVAAYQWIMANQAQAAVQASGAEASSWSGVMHESDGGALGLAAADGSVTYDRQQVLAPVWEMAQNAGQPAHPAMLARWRNALQTMYHENTHFLNANGRSIADGIAQGHIGSVRAFEEGVTEAWSASQVNDYIRALGAEHLAPGISGAVVRQPYPQYVGATQALADGLGRDTGLGRQEVMRQLAVQDAGRKWPAAAELAYRSGGLDSLVPPQHRDIVLGRIQASMQQPFERLAQASGTPAQQHLASMAAGHQAVSGYRAEVQAMRQHYISQLPQQQQQVSNQQQQQQQGPQQQTPTQQTPTQQTPTQQTATQQTPQQQTPTQQTPQQQGPQQGPRQTPGQQMPGPQQGPVQQGPVQQGPQVTQSQPSIQERLNPPTIAERLNPTDGQTPQPSRISQALNPQESRITQALNGQHTATPTTTPTDPRQAYAIGNNPAGAPTEGQNANGPAGATTGGNQALPPDLQKAMAAASSGTAPASAIKDAAAKESGQGARPDHLDRGSQSPQRGHDGPDR